jgi:hypothetical protein
MVGCLERSSAAFTERTVQALERMDARPPGADPRVTAQFLSGGVLLPARMAQHRLNAGGGHRPAGP